MRGKAGWIFTYLFNEEIVSTLLHSTEHDNSQIINTGIQLSFSMDSVFDQLRKHIKKYLTEDKNFSEKQADEEIDKVLTILDEICEVLKNDFYCGKTNEGSIGGLITFKFRGGTSYVFNIQHIRTGMVYALKFPRPDRLDDSNGINKEINLLKKLNHKGIVRFFDSREISLEGRSIPFIIEEWIDGKESGNYFKEKCEKILTNSMNFDSGPLHELINEFLSFVRESAEVLDYINKQGYVYLDFKPKNCMIDKDKRVVLVDMGSIEKLLNPRDNVINDDDVSLAVSEPYSHPFILQWKTGDGTRGDHLSIRMKRSKLKRGFDYYSLGITILELLQDIEAKLGEKITLSPRFRALHFLATRLLDGENNKNGSSLIQIRARNVPYENPPYTIGEVFPGLTSNDYDVEIRYESLVQFIIDVRKEEGAWTLESEIPEMSLSPVKLLRIIPLIMTTMTDNLKSLIEHPLFSRLKYFSQLGFVSFVYPTATDTRYEHSIGVYTYSLKYIRALFNDPWYPVFRGLVTRDDATELMLAAILHDLGQFPLAHDIEEVAPELLLHSIFSINFLSSDIKDKEGHTIKDIIMKWFPDAKNDDEKNAILGVIADIINKGSHYSVSSHVNINLEIYKESIKSNLLSAVIDGPIDCDKIDYIQRDSKACGLTYGGQIDHEKLINDLTYAIDHDEYGNFKSNLGVYERGKISAEAVTFARYEMFESVYWHHVVRIIKTMIQHLVALKLPEGAFSSSASEDKSSKEFKNNFGEYIKTLGTDLNPISQEGYNVNSYDELMIKHFENMRIINEKFIGHSNASTGLAEDLIRRVLYKELVTVGFDSVSRLLDGANNYFPILVSKPSDALMDLIYNLKWDKKAEISIKLNEKVKDILYKDMYNPETGIKTKEEFDKKLQNKFILLIDIPPDPASKRGFKRNLSYVPNETRKRYFQSGGIVGARIIEAKEISEIAKVLYESIWKISILVHPDAFRTLFSTKEIVSEIDKWAMELIFAAISGKDVMNYDLDEHRVKN